MTEKLRVALVGCGNIGEALCQAVKEGAIPAEIAALTDPEVERAERLRTVFAPNAAIGSIDAAAAETDLLVECAEGGAVPSVLDAAARHGRDCLIMSVGGLAADNDALDKARNAGVNVRVPSGAICGLDGLRAAMEGGVTRVRLTTRKPPAGLRGAPHIEATGFDLDGLTEAATVFEGTAREAIKAFPKNVNVAAALSLAGVGLDGTEVRVVADPTSDVNSHEIEVEGAFGRLRTVTENKPSPANPKTSYLASLSACAELRAAAEAFIRCQAGA